MRQIYDNKVQTGTYIIQNIANKRFLVLDDKSYQVRVAQQNDTKGTRWLVKRREDNLYSISSESLHRFLRCSDYLVHELLVTATSIEYGWNIRKIGLKGEYIIYAQNQGPEFYCGFPENGMDGARLRLKEEGSSGSKELAEWTFYLADAEGEDGTTEENPEEPPPPPSTDDSTVHVEGNIALRTVDGKYMKVSSTNGLYFSAKYDASALFRVIKKGGGKIELKGYNGKIVNMYYVDDVKCEGPGGGLSMGIKNLGKGKINLTISGYQGQNGKTFYLSSEPGHEAYNGSLAVKRSEDVSCRFVVENPSPTASTVGEVEDPIIRVEGSIAVRNIDGNYLKVTSSNGLVFSADYEASALFHVVKKGNSRFELKGCNGKIVNMYGLDDVKCEGPGGGLSMSTKGLGKGWINLIISGYQGQNGKIFYLSSEPGNEAYNGSLAVKRSEDASCRFIIESK